MAMMGPPSRSWVLIFTCLLLAAKQAIALSQQIAGGTLILDGVPFFIPPAPVSQLPLSKETQSKELIGSIGGRFPLGLVPFSVISTNTSRFDDAALSRSVEGFKAVDDVWSPSFLNGSFSPHSNQVWNLILRGD